MLTDSCSKENVDLGAQNLHCPMIFMISKNNSGVEKTKRNYEKKFKKQRFVLERRPFGLKFV